MTEFPLEPFWTGYTVAICGAQMSYCSFVPTPATSLGCDGWHCSGWLGGVAGVQQINAVEIMQNIYFLSFNTYINTAPWKVLLAGQGKCHHCPHVAFLSSASCTIVLPCKANVLTETTPYWDQLQRFYSHHQNSLDWQTTLIHLALSYKLGQLAQFYPNKQAHSICYKIQTHLFSQESQSWFARGLSSPRHQENHSSGNNQSQ